MSRCDDIQEFLYGEPAGSQLPTEVASHLDQCPACRACRDDLLAMADGMQGFDLPQLPDGFDLSLRRRLVAEARQPASTVAPSAGRRWVPALIAAAATILLVASGLLLYSRGQPVGPADDVSYHRLHLSIRALGHHDNAAFNIKLPAGVRLAPELGALADASGTLRWSSDLKPGTNEVDLPLLCTSDDPGRITARLTVDGRTLTTTVPLVRARRAARPGRTIHLALAVAAGGRVVR